MYGESLFDASSAEATAVALGQLSTIAWIVAGPVMLKVVVVEGAIVGTGSVADVPAATLDPGCALEHPVVTTRMIAPMPEPTHCLRCILFPLAPIPALLTPRLPKVGS